MRTTVYTAKAVGVVHHHDMPKLDIRCVLKENVDLLVGSHQNAETCFC